MQASALNTCPVVKIPQKSCPEMLPGTRTRGSVLMPPTPSGLPNNCISPAPISRLELALGHSSSWTANIPLSFRYRRRSSRKTNHDRKSLRFSCLSLCLRGRSEPVAEIVREHPTTVVGVEPPSQPFLKNPPEVISEPDHSLLVDLARNIQVVVVPANVLGPQIWGFNDSHAGIWSGTEADRLGQRAGDAY